MSDQTSNATTPAQVQAALQGALNTPLPRFYVNSFINASTPNDILTIFQCNGQNLCVFNFGYVFAKTMAKALNGMVEDYEKRNQITVPIISVETSSSA
jgi:hypothetical protein